MTSAQRKLERSAEQVKTLLAEAAAFRDAEAYAFDTERELRSPNEVDFRCFATEREAPPSEWPLLAGEAIQNVRAALDHAIWAAWRSVAANSGEGNHTQFVICDEPAQFKDVRRRLKGVPEPVRALVERSQPYNRWPKAPADDALSILRRLSNADKHRTLAVVASAVEFEMIGLDQRRERQRVEPRHRKAAGRGHSTDFVFRRSLRHRDRSYAGEPRLLYDIQIEGFPLSILKHIIRVVFEVVTECETGSRPHLFAAYPI